MLRNDILVDEFDMSRRGSIRYGASDGDRFLVRRAGLPDLHYLYGSPDGCASQPELEVRVSAGCDGLLLTLTNHGSDSFDGLVLLLRGTEPDGEALPPVAPGTTEIPVAIIDGDGWALITGPLGPDAAYWVVGLYAQPAGCATPAPTPSTPEPATPAPGSPGEDEGTGGDEGSGGGLPVTGNATLAYAIGGLLLVGAGLVVVMVTRRRQPRFPSGE